MASDQLMKAEKSVVIAEKQTFAGILNIQWSIMFKESRSNNIDKVIDSMAFLVLKIM